nr:cyclin-A2-4-like isoform X1 [Tanacetum cinerariifolium]
KYEEICAPAIEEFCFITDSTYSKLEVMEVLMSLQGSQMETNDSTTSYMLRAGVKIQSMGWTMQVLRTRLPPLHECYCASSCNAPLRKEDVTS